MEIKLKVNKRTKAGKAFLAMLDVFLKDTKGVEIVPPTYDPNFVKKIKKAEKEIEKGEYSVVDTDDVWGSLGL